MNALPNDLIQQTTALSESVTRPIPGSHKVYVQGSRPDLRVPMRAISASISSRSASAGSRLMWPFRVSLRMAPPLSGHYAALPPPALNCRLKRGCPNGLRDTLGT